MSVTMVRSYHQQDEDETEVEADSITKGNTSLIMSPKFCVMYAKVLTIIIMQFIFNLIDMTTLLTETLFCWS